MDPSIMKLLEEDEDESMHSGADVDAFQAALNRDIGGDASTSQAPSSDKDLDQLGSHSANQAFPGWQSTNNQDEMKNSQLQQEQRHMQHQERMQSETELKQHGEAKDPKQKDIHQEVNHLLLHQRQSQDDLQSGQGKHIPHQIPQMIGMQVSEPERSHTADGDSQYLKLQKMSNQQAMLPDQNRSNRVKQVPFARLLPVILPQLDKDRAMQLQTLYVKLKNNVIPKEGFVRIMRGIVGDQMLKLAVMKIQQSGSNQFHMQGEASAPQSHPRMQSAAPAKFNESQSFPQLHQKGNSETSHSVSSLVQDRDHTSAPVQGLNRQQQQQQQQHLQNMQATFPMYGSGVPYHTFSGTHVTSNASSGKSQSQDFQMKQVPSHQSMGSNQPGSMGQAMNTGVAPKFERPNSIGDSKRMMNGSISAFMNNNPSMQQGSIPWRPPITKEQTSGPFSAMGYVKPEPVDHSNDQQHKSQLTTPHSLSSASAEQTDHKFPPLAGNSRDGSLDPQSPGVGFLPATSAGPSYSESTSMSTEDPNVQVGSRTSLSTPGTNSRTPTKKVSAGQKKPLEAPGSSPPPSSKKQKVSGNFADQSIEQLIDVTAVSGVNLREEEEQLFSGSKEDSRVSEASRRVVQEEEEASILQKAPLQKRLAEIMVKCGVKTLSNDVERCLSLCVEERMRGLLSNLIRFSKQRVDAEKPRHRTIITSDVRHQLTLLNRKAREEYDKKLAEAVKQRKLNEPEGSNAADGDKDKDDKNGKGTKVNREEDDKMRTTAANVAARAAVGGDDMLSKWQLMAEQARQKREGVPDVASGSQGSKDSGTGKVTSASGRSTKDPNNSGKRVSSSGTRKGKNRAVSPQPRVARSICVKDVISVLEREPQMSKSSLMYRLYDKVHSDPTGE